jgi:hypothetical protein
MSNVEAWAALLLLGAFHGINPGMGWLFAVGLGMQRQSRRAVYEALGPIALGHALSIGLIVILVVAAGVIAPLAWIRWPAGLGLIGFGVYKLLRSRHPRWVGMVVGFRDLVTWSFLMASAHGAGLMLVPVLLGWGTGPEVHDHAGHGGGAHAEHGTAFAAVAATPLLALLAVGIHTLGYLAVMGLVAVVIYEKVGLAILRKAWFNLDRAWAAALILTGGLTLVV